MSRLIYKLPPLIVVLLLLASCSSHKKESKHTLRNDHTVVAVVNFNAKGVQKKILDEATSWLGTPYEYAGAEKGRGTDCSGMVMQVYLAVLDCKIPRNSAKQAEFCEVLSADEVQPGDLVFFATGKDPDRVSHVGIMLDRESFIHSSTSKGVCISKVTTPYYVRTFKMFGRVPRLVSMHNSVSCQE